MATQESRYNWLQSITDLAQYINQGNQKKLQETEGLLRIGEMKKKLYEEEASKRMATSFIGNIQKAATAEELNKLNVDILKQSTEAGLLNVYNMVQPAVQTRHYEFADTEKKETQLAEYKSILKSVEGNLFGIGGSLVPGKNLTNKEHGIITVDPNVNPGMALAQLKTVVSNNAVYKELGLTFNNGNYSNTISYKSKQGEIFEATGKDKDISGVPIIQKDNQYFYDTNRNGFDETDVTVDAETSSKVSEMQYKKKREDQMLSMQLGKQDKGSKFKYYPTQPTVTKENIPINTEKELVFKNGNIYATTKDGKEILYDGSWKKHNTSTNEITTSGIENERMELMADIDVFLTQFKTRSTLKHDSEDNEIRYELGIAQRLVQNDLNYFKENIKGAKEENNDDKLATAQKGFDYATSRNVELQIILDKYKKYFESKDNVNKPSIFKGKK